MKELEDVLKTFRTAALIASEAVEQCINSGYLLCVDKRRGYNVPVDKKDIRDPVTTGDIISFYVIGTIIGNKINAALVNEEKPESESVLYPNGNITDFIESILNCEFFDRMRLKYSGHKALNGLYFDAGEALGFLARGPNENLAMMHQNTSSFAKYGQCVVFDPLDGTNYLMMGSKEYSIPIAFMDEDKVVAALIYSSGANKNYSAIINQGAFEDSLGNHKKNNLHVSDTNEISKIVMGIGKRATLEFLEPFSDAGIKNYRILPGMTNKIMHVADGRIDAYPSLFDSIGIHDTSAGFLIAKECAGIATDKNGDKIVYQRSAFGFEPNSNGLVVSNNQMNHKRIIEITSKMQVYDSGL